MKRRRSWGHEGLALGAFLGAVLLLGGCSTPPAAPAAQGRRVSGLAVETVRLEKIPNEVAAPGTVAAVRTAQITSRVMAVVLRVAVREGDRVRRGQLLVALDEREFAARRNAAGEGLREAAAAEEAAARGVAAAKAEAEVAGKTYKRYEFLREQKSVSPQEFDEVQAKDEAARAALAQARARRQQAQAARARAVEQLAAAATVAGYARLDAPFDGVVLHRYVDPGSMAVPGTPLVVVEEAGRYRLEATLDAADAAAVRRGTPARVQLDALPGKELPGTVAELEPGADPTSHTVEVKIDLPRDPALRSGLFGRAWFERGERAAIVVPASAIVERGQLRGLYAVDASGTARWRLVTLGEAAGKQVEVLSGLSAGERIVTDPRGRELDGARVEAEK
jgi:membrane fusion protein, multidrug efflux system